MPPPKKRSPGQMGGKREGSGAKKIHWGGSLEGDIEILKRHCWYQVTREAAACMLNVEVKTIDARLREYGTTWKDFFEIHKHGGLGALRMASYRGAVEDRVPSLIIWNEKNLLGWSDKTEVAFDQDKPVRFRLVMGKNLNEEKEDG